MFRTFFSRELRRVLTSVTFWVFFVILLWAGFMNGSNTNPGRTYIVQTGQGFHNAPVILALLMAYLSALGALFTMVFVGRSVARDFEANTHHFFFSSPVTRLGYLGGRFAGSYAANLLLFVAVFLGTAIGCAVIDPRFSGPWEVGSIAYAFFVILAPNVFLIGVVLFSLAALTRSMISTYIAGVALMMTFLMALSSGADMDNQWLKVIADPLGAGVIDATTQFWSFHQRNTEGLPLNLFVLVNRGLWLLLGSAIAFFTWRKFRFESEVESRWRKKKIVQPEPVRAVPKSEAVSTLSYSTKRYLILCLSSAYRDFRRLAFHPAFIILTLLAARMMYHNFTENAGPNGSNVYPITSWFLRYANLADGMMIPITVFFAGVLVRRERDYRTAELLGAMPTPDWVGYASKLIALLSVQLFFVLAMCLTGILSQTIIFGYTDIEADLYFKTLGLIHLVTYWKWAVIVMLIQIVVPNKYVGFLVSAIFFAVDVILFKVLELGGPMLQYAGLPEYLYSNMNGFGHYAEPLFWYRIYWLCFAGLLVVVSYLLWHRGVDGLHRLREAKRRLRLPQVAATVVLAGAFLATGSYIFYNTRVVNPRFSEDRFVQDRADYEKKYKNAFGSKGLRISDIRLNVSIFPEARDVFVEGRYRLVNPTGHPVDTVLLNLASYRISSLNRLELSRPFEILVTDQGLGVYVLKLLESVGPDSSVDLDFEVACVTEGFFESFPNDDVMENGTLIDNSPFLPARYFPAVGYQRPYEIMNAHDREEYGLPARPPVPPLDDVDARNATFADLVTFDARISTSSDQVVVASGNLLASWSEADRNHYHISSDTLMSNMIIITSGRYEVKREQYAGVDIEVYFDPKHPQNIDRMLLGSRRGLDYCNRNFSPYPFRVLRIVEVPNNRVGGTASSQPAVFTWNENGGFISNLEDPDAIDVVFNTTTHEMAHQWWAHIVRPATVVGAGVVTETMCQWVRLMCMEKEYGVEKTRRFLEDELQDYLFRRGRDTQGEVPLKHAGTQTYLNYRKGSLVMYALGKYIGEEAVNRALKTIVQKAGMSDSVYANTEMLVDEFRKVTPDSLQYLITDLFEDIVLWENKATEAKYEPLGDGRYRVRLTVESKKLRSDGLGAETPVALNDYIEIGVLDENGTPLYLEKKKFTDSPASFEVVVPSQPASAGIDPFNLLIDRDGDDNAIEF